MDIVSRVKGILLSPKTEWPVIAGESATVNSLYTGYAMILAAIPAICSFIGTSLIGVSAGGISFKVPLVAGILIAVISYVLGLVGYFIQAKIIEAVAPSFGGKADTVSALKLVVYSATPALIAGVFGLVPMLGLIAMLGALYGLYLLFLGVRPITNCPEDKSLVMTLAIIGITIVVMFVIYFVVGIVSTTLVRMFV